MLHGRQKIILKNKIKMKNLIINFFSKKYFFSIIKKIFKRFEKDTSIEATQWAKLHVKHSTEEFCKSIDSCYMMRSNQIQF